MQEDIDKKTEKENKKLILSVIGKIVQEERKKLKKGINLFSYEYDIGNGLLSKLEHGQSDSRITTIWKLANIFGYKCSDFIKIVEYARSKRMSVEIFTNGQTLYDNTELLNKLIELYPYSIGLSLYSLNEETHDKITSVKGSYHKTLSVIEKLREKNISVEIKNFLLNTNCKDCISVKDYARKLNATSVADLSLIPTMEGDNKTLEYVVKEDDLFELYTNPKSPLYFKDIKERDINKMKNESLCYAGCYILCITPNLDVRPCVSLPIDLDNLKKVSLKDIWESAKNKNQDSKLYKWMQISYKDLKECYKEDYCKFCAYCPGMGMLENGFLKKSDVLCRQAKAKQKAYEYNRKNS